MGGGVGVEQMGYLLKVPFSKFFPRFFYLSLEIILSDYYFCLLRMIKAAKSRN